MQACFRSGFDLLSAPEKPMGYLHTLYYIQMLRARDEAKKQREKDEEERRKKKKNSESIKDYRFSQMKGQIDSRRLSTSQAKNN